MDSVAVRDAAETACAAAESGSAATAVSTRREDTTVAFIPAFYRIAKRGRQRLARRLLAFNAGRSSPQGGAEDMAKQRKLLPESKPSGRPRADESLSLRSAESLGRVIGTLHRQLNGAMRLVTGHQPDGAPTSSTLEEKPASSSRRTRPRLAAS